MDIARHDGGPQHDAERCIRFCLDQLETARRFSAGVNWYTEIVPGCTIEEIVGALVAAERDFLDVIIEDEEE